MAYILLFRVVLSHICLIYHNETFDTLKLSLVIMYIVRHRQAVVISPCPWANQLSVVLSSQLSEKEREREMSVAYLLVCSFVMAQCEAATKA